MGEIKQKHYLRVKERHGEVITAVEKLGEAVKNAGPIKEKDAELIQLSAALAIRSEGAVHSHVKRALEAGATEEDLYHTLILLTSTIGFPTVMAGTSWINDVMKK